MAKSKTVFICSQCGFESPKWNGKCQVCGSWNSFEEEDVEIVKAARKASAKSMQIMELGDIEIDGDVRYNTGSGELDRVLGGGLVKGSLVLLGGEPGIGKSTLMLQICQFLGEEHSVLYISGEESARQLKIRAQRLGVDSQNLYILAATDAQAVCATVRQSQPHIVIIDSVQTMSIPEITSAPGSLVQVRECTNLFMHLAKEEEIPVLIVGHVNKDGAIAGPKVMEHIVDAVLYFEGERNLSYRILRAVKNRYGSTNEIGVFEMCDAGLKEVPEPSLMLLSGRLAHISGSCIACMMEGTRPILSEVQALAAKSGFTSPRRTATGFDYNRMAIIIAVLEKRGGLFFGTLDVFLNVVGGLRLDEPAADLPVAIALCSAVLDRAIDSETTAFGEIGLAGEIRSVSHTEKRIRECQRMGFTRIIIPANSLKEINPDDFTAKIEPISSIKQIFALLEGKNEG